MYYIYICIYIYIQYYSIELKILTKLFLRFIIITKTKVYKRGGITLRINLLYIFFINNIYKFELKMFLINCDQLTVEAFLFNVKY
jgi:hypothetical protein